MKYICVGQPKTGTKTISKIFNLLNFKTNTNPIICNQNDDFVIIDKIKYYTDDTILKCHDNIVKFDALQDYPYSFNYEYINVNFPDSVYILTIRDNDSWFNSLLNYQNLYKTATSYKLLKKLYGYEIISLENKTEIILKYNEYNTNIIKYFDDKPAKLLIINLADEKDDDIKIKLSNFLKINIDFEIPYENKSSYK